VQSSNGVVAVSPINKGTVLHEDKRLFNESQTIDIDELAKEQNVGVFLEKHLIKSYNTAHVIVEGHTQLRVLKDISTGEEILKFDWWDSWTGFINDALIETRTLEGPQLDLIPQTFLGQLHLSAGVLWQECNQNSHTYTTTLDGFLRGQPLQLRNNPNQKFAYNLTCVETLLQGKAFFQYYYISREKLTK